MTTAIDGPSDGRTRSPGLGPAFGLAEENREIVSGLLAVLREPGAGYRFPWEKLEEDLSNPDARLRLFGYGSLLNLASAVATIPGSREGLEPAVAFGLIRVFDYVMPDEVIRRHGPLGDPRARAALNAYPTRHVEDVVNGVLVRVGAADLPALRVREAGYDLVPVPCLPWPDPSGDPIVAYVLSCPAVPVDGIVRTDDSLTPHVKYLEMCLDGAGSISLEFRDLFLATTHLDRSGRRIGNP